VPLPHRLMLTLVSACLHLLSTPVNADISLPKFWSDGAVIQRNSTTRIWGWANEGEVISVTLNGKLIGNAEAHNGQWSIPLGAHPAGGPHRIDISGSNRISLQDLYFGDVWVAAGQSNMQTTMDRVSELFEADIASANIPLLRQFTVPRVLEFSAPQRDFSAGKWEPSTPKSVLPHSAVAHFFGRKLVRDEQIPIGILSTNFGGSPAECWLAEEQLKPYPELYNTAKRFQDIAYLQKLKDADKRYSDDWYAQLSSQDAGLLASPKWYQQKASDSHWKAIQLPANLADQGVAPMSGIVWLQKTITLPDTAIGKAAKLRLGTMVDADTVYVNGTEVGKTYYLYPPRRYSVANTILRAGDNTITVRLQINNNAGEWVTDKPYYLQVGELNIPLSGEWHYRIGTKIEPFKTPHYTPYNQPLGCYNAMLAPLLELNIKGVIWYQGESNSGRPNEYARMFPQLIQHWREEWRQGDFPFLFVQLPNFMKAESEPSESLLAETRNAQMQALALNNTAMVVTIDVGEWNDIHPLNKKPVGERLALAAQALAYGKKDVVYSGPQLKSVSAKNNALVITFDHTGSGLVARGEKLQGFALAGDDGKYYWASAKIRKNTVEVLSPHVKKPVKVRYAWANNPTTANLYNLEGLPASPFEGGLYSQPRKLPN